MKKCECCQRETPESNMFRYKYEGITYNVCNNCYINVEEYVRNKKENILLSPRELNEIELKNKQNSERIEKIDFNVLPDYYLARLLNFIRDKDFNEFKITFLEFEEEIRRYS